MRFMSDKSYPRVEHNFPDKIDHKLDKFDFSVVPTTIFQIFYMLLTASVVTVVVLLVAPILFFFTFMFLFIFLFM